MTIELFDLELDEGVSFTKVFTWKDPSTTLPIDLTGYTAKLQVRWVIGDPNIRLELTTENGGIVLGGVNGTITLVITPTQTTNLATSLYLTRGLYDLLLTKSSVVTKYTEGFVYIEPGITH